MGTFVAAGAGLVLSLGVLKISQIAIKSVQVSNTLQAEQELYVTIRQMLSDAKDCRWNLDPSRLSNKTHKKGQLIDSDNKLRGYIKTGGNNVDSDPRTSEDDTPYLALGDFKSGLISVKSLELLRTGPDNLKWTFAVYYSKPQSGSYKTLESAECSATDNTGCYHQSCDLKIRHIPAPADSTKSIIADDSCSLLNCYNVGGGLNVSCNSPGTYLYGFDDRGNKDCRPIWPCPKGKVYVGKKEDGTSDCRILPKLPEVGKFECSNAEEVLQGFDANGEPICRSVCSGGKVYKKATFSCECPVNTPYYYNNVCNQCPSATPHYYNNMCHICPITEHYYNGVCNECPRHTPYSYDQVCNKCSMETPYYNNGMCYKCPIDWEVDPTCEKTCPGELVWSEANQACKCPQDSRGFVIKRGDTCGCIGNLSRLANGDCGCRSDQIFRSGYCVCPSEKPWDDKGVCKPCPNSKVWDGTVCQCPGGPDFEHNGGCQTCRAYPFYHNGGCQTCTTTYYHNGKCRSCLKKFFNPITDKCCPNNTRYDRNTRKCRFSSPSPGNIFVPLGG